METSVTVGQAFDLFMAQRTAKGLAKESLRGYKTWLGPFVRTFADIPIGELADEMIGEYIGQVISRVHKNKISHNTAASTVRNVKIFLKFISQEAGGDVPFSYKKIESIRPTKKVFSSYSKEQIEEIFKAAASAGGWIGLRNQAIFSLALDSGMRRSEIAALTYEEFMRGSTGGDMVLHVVGKGSRERFVPVGRHTVTLVMAYLDECPFRDKYLFVSRFGDGLRPNSYEKITEAVAKQLDFPFSMHLMRHHFATTYLKATYEKGDTMDAYGLRAILGHSSFSTTDMYVHSVISILAAKRCNCYMDRFIAGETEE